MKRLPWIPLAALALAVLIASIAVPHFLDAAFLLDQTTLYAEIGFLALGATLVIVSGNIDLSVGSVVALTACLIAKAMASGVSAPLAVLIGVAVGGGIGALNGLLIAKFKLPSFLVTLAAMATCRGIAEAMMGPASIKLPDGFKGIDRQLFAGIPAPLVLFLGLAILCGLALHQTTFGRKLYALGTNEKAAFYSGLSVDRLKIVVFAISGVLAGLGGVVIDSRLGVARHDLGKSFELDAITIAVVGGCAIQGGEGTILGTVVTFFLVFVIRTAMAVANVQPEFQLTAIGALLVLAVGVGQLRKRR